MINFIIDTQKMINDFGESDLLPIVQYLVEHLEPGIIHDADENVDFKLYISPTQKGTTGQRRAWKTASLVTITDEGINDSLKVTVWLGHPEYMKNPELVVAGAATIVGHVVCKINGKEVKHEKGNYTPEFNEIMSHLDMKIVSRNRVGTNPQTKLVAGKFEAEIKRILNFPLTKGFKNEKAEPVKPRVRMSCAPDCDMNKIRGTFNVLETDLVAVQASLEAKCRTCGSEIKVHQDVETTKKDSKKETVPTN
jgi:hypothetical protein